MKLHQYISRAVGKTSIIYFCLLLNACDRGAHTSVNPVSSSDRNQPPELVDDGPYQWWQDGSFPPYQNFAHYCQNPREQNTLDMMGTVFDENNWLRSISNFSYLWYDEITDVDPTSIDTALEYFSLMRTFELTPAGNLKDRFHFSMNTQDWERLSAFGVSVGYGMTLKVISSRPPRKVIVAYTEPNTPATTNKANLKRGAEILAIDGVDVINTTNAEEVSILNSGLSPKILGESHEFLIKDLGALEPRKIVLQAIEVTSTPVQNVGVIETNSGSVGYMLFNDHISTSEQQLIEAINLFNQRQVSDLVLDLRYNGGGFLDIANELAYMIAGNYAAGQIFDQLQFNEKHPVFNPLTGDRLAPTTFRSAAKGFSATANSPLPSLNLSRLFVLTGTDTCSASEAIINGLRGIDFEVIQVGNNTCGKPYGFYPMDNCGTTYFTIQFRSANAKGFGDYSDGFSPRSDLLVATGDILPGCRVGDDLTSPLGDRREARLAAALRYREYGTCPDVSSDQGAIKMGSGNDGYVLKPQWLGSMTALP